MRCEAREGSGLFLRLVWLMWVGRQRCRRIKHLFLSGALSEGRPPGAIKMVTPYAIGSSKVPRTASSGMRCEAREGSGLFLRLVWLMWVGRQRCRRIKHLFLSGALSEGRPPGAIKMVTPYAIGLSSQWTNRGELIRTAT